MKKHLFLCVAGFGLAGLAGEASIMGSATVAADPDCVTLSISVNSECYGTPSAASHAADTAVKNIYGFLKGLVKENRDQVSTDGGYTQTYERYIEGKTYCQGTYQKGAKLTVNIRNTSDFIRYFDAIQEKVFSESSGQAMDLNAARTTVRMGAPNPELFDEHERTLSMTARGRAVDNALSKFLASVPMSCKITGYEIAGISDPSVSRDGYESKTTAAAPSSGNSGGAVVSFGKQSVTENVLVKIKYDGGQCSEAIQRVDNIDL